VKDRALSQRRLCPAVAALKNPLVVSSVSVVVFTVALWTPETFRPASILKSCFALLLIAILGKELIQAHAWL
jgi:hypothetical protein